MGKIGYSRCRFFEKPNSHSRVIVENFIVLTSLFISVSLCSFIKFEFVLFKTVNFYRSELSSLTKLDSRNSNFKPKNIFSLFKTDTLFQKTRNFVSVLIVYLINFRNLFDMLREDTYFFLDKKTFSYQNFKNHHL